MNKRNFKGWLYLPAMLFSWGFSWFALLSMFLSIPFEEGYNSASQTYYGTGMYNYSYVLHDPYFLQAIRNTFYPVVITVPFPLCWHFDFRCLKLCKSSEKTFPDHLLPAICNQTLAVGLVFMILFKKPLILTD